MAVSLANSPAPTNPTGTAHCHCDCDMWKGVDQNLTWSTKIFRGSDFNRRGEGIESSRPGDFLSFEASGDGWLFSVAWARPICAPQARTTSIAAAIRSRVRKHLAIH